jgi:uncharacterized protein (TIGR03435 family)
MHPIYRLSIIAIVLLFHAPVHAQVAFDAASIKENKELSDVYYDLNAKPQAKVTRDETFAMFRALIVERFKLAFHRETREVDGFALVQAKTGTLGPNLKPSPIDCGEQAHSATPKCREGMITMSTMKVNGGSIWSLVNLLVSHVRAPMIDETTLTGAFDIDFRWSPDMAPTGDLPSI